MLSRNAIVAVVIAAIVLSWGGFSIPRWALVAFAITIVPFAVAASWRQKRMEDRVVRSLWKILTRR